MKIILQQDYPTLGSELDVMVVKDGYARNFLIPEGIAIPATKGNLKHAEEMKKYSAKRVDRAVADAEALAAKVNETACNFTVKVKAGDDIYGSVTATDISESLKEGGLEVSKASVLLAEPIKKIGFYEVSIKLHKSVTATLKVTVDKEAAEA
jgi:large subunit ribosomal protein L9